MIRQLTGIIGFALLSVMILLPLGGCARHPAADISDKTEAVSAVPVAARIMQSVEVGKWPEQIAPGAGSAWVACSGSRYVAQVSLGSGEILRKVRTGRFPVSIASFDDKVFSVDYNSGQGIFVIDAQGGVTGAGRLPDHPEEMAAGKDAVYVLLWQDGSSIGSSVVRIDPAAYVQKRSEDLGPDAMGIAFGGNRLWVCADNCMIELDAHTLAVAAKADIGTECRQAAANSTAAYTIGLDGGRIIRVDALSYSALHSEPLEQSVIAANDEYVFALGVSGTLRLYDPQSLKLLAELPLGRAVEAKHMICYKDKLLVSEHTGGDDPGRLTTIELQK